MILTLRQGRLHHVIRLHHLAARRRKGPLRRNMRLVPRLQVLPRPRQVRRANARRRPRARAPAEMGLGPRKTRPKPQPGLAPLRNDRSARPVAKGEVVSCVKFRESERGRERKTNVNEISMCIFAWRLETWWGFDL